MAQTGREVVQQLADRILADLIHPGDDIPAGYRAFVDELADVAPDGLEHYAVSLGAGLSVRTVEVEVIAVGAGREASISWAAEQIADAFQDEVIELVHSGRPACPSHAHPMVVASDELSAWWQCPVNREGRLVIWPSA